MIVTVDTWFINSLINSIIPILTIYKKYLNSLMSTLLGKLLITLSLLFQAYLLFENSTLATAFNTKLQAALEACNCIPAHIAAHILQHGRLLVVGLLASSVLMVLFRCWFFKLLPLLALSALLYIEHQPFTKVPCIGCTRLWEKVAVIGAVIYLMGSDCAATSCNKPSATKNTKKLN